MGTHQAAEIHHNGGKIVVVPPSSSSSISNRFECFTDLPEATSAPPAERTASSATSGPADFLSGILSRIDKQTRVEKTLLEMDEEVKVSHPQTANFHASATELNNQAVCTTHSAYNSDERWKS